MSKRQELVGNLCEELMFSNLTILEAKRKYSNTLGARFVKLVHVKLGELI